MTDVLALISIDTCCTAKQTEKSRSLRIMCWFLLRFWILESDEGHLKQDKHLILFWTNTISNKELCKRNNTIPLSQHISTRKWKWIADVQLYVECTQVPSKW